MGTWNRYVVLMLTDNTKNPNALRHHLTVAFSSVSFMGPHELMTANWPRYCTFLLHFR